MPCTMTGSIEGDQLLGTREDLTKMTDMLCRTLTLLEMNDVFLESVGRATSKTTLPKDIQQFWKEHKKLDKKRIDAEKKSKELIRKKALSKLTKEEIAILGIKV